MFPELMRDEVFRIETARFWLRWPTNAERRDDDRAAARQEPESAEASKPGLLSRWVAENGVGDALNLLMAPKTGGPAVGFVRIGPGPGQAPTLDFAVEERWQARDAAAEALRTVLDIVFRVTDLPGLLVLPQRLGRCGRRTIESLGFTPTGSHQDVELFGFDRALWHRQADRCDASRVAPMVETDALMACA